MSDNQSTKTKESIKRVQDGQEAVTRALKAAAKKFKLTEDEARLVMVSLLNGMLTTPVDVVRHNYDLEQEEANRLAFVKASHKQAAVQPTARSALREAVKPRVLMVIRNHLEEQNLREEDSLVNDLGADSLEQVEIFMALEDEFEFDGDDDVAEKVTTVGQAIDAVTDALYENNREALVQRYGPQDQEQGEK